MGILSDDIIRDILLRVAQAAPGFEEGLMIEIERQARHDWAGSEPYIAADPDRAQRIAQARQELASGRPVAVVRRRTGVPRSTLYDLLRGRRKA